MQAIALRVVYRSLVDGATQREASVRAGEVVGVHWTTVETWERSFRTKGYIAVRASGAQQCVLAVHAVHQKPHMTYRARAIIYGIDRDDDDDAGSFLIHVCFLCSFSFIFRE